MKYNVYSKHGMYPMGKIIWATYPETMRQTVACVIRERLNKFSRSSEEVQVLFSFKINKNTMEREAYLGYFPLKFG